MLVIFTCEAYENITMFGDVALHLIRMMGHSGTVPGAILAEDVPEALAHLKRSMAGDTQNDGLVAKSSDDDKGDEESVSLAHRAFPLLQLLQAAVQAECNVSWRQG